MNANELIVGLDIGTTKIACFVGTRDVDGMVKILGFGKTDSIGVEHGVVRSITNTAESIKKAVSEASEQADVPIEEVWVGIAGQHIKSRPSHGSVMIPQGQTLIEQADVDRLISEQHNVLLESGEEIIHIFPQQYIVDGVPLSREIPPAGVAGNVLEADFHMVTGNAQNLQHIRFAIERAGLRTKGVVLEPVASSMAVLDDRDREAGVAMVDIGGGTTDIAIFYDGIIRHTSVLPLAGNTITKDIQEGCSVLKRQAENLKVRFGSCLVQAVSDKDFISIPGIHHQAPREISVKNLAKIINARTKQLLEQVEYEINISGYQKQLFAGVVLTGGGAQLKDIKDLCELITATGTRVGIPNEHLSPNSVGYDELAHPMFATGIGLVLFGLEQSAMLEAPEPEEETTENKHVDLFYDMPTTPEPPTPAPAPSTESKAKEGKSRFGLNAIDAWLKRQFTDDID